MIRLIHGVEHKLRIAGDLQAAALELHPRDLITGSGLVGGRLPVQVRLDKQPHRALIHNVHVPAITLRPAHASDEGIHVGVHVFRAVFFPIIRQGGAILGPLFMEIPEGNPRLSRSILVHPVSGDAHIGRHGVRLLGWVGFDLIVQGHRVVRPLNSVLVDVTAEGIAGLPAGGKDILGTGARLGVHEGAAVLIHQVGSHIPVNHLILQVHTGVAVPPDHRFDLLFVNVADLETAHIGLGCLLGAYPHLDIGILRHSHLYRPVSVRGNLPGRIRIDNFHLIVFTGHRHGHRILGVVQGGKADFGILGQGGDLHLLPVLLSNEVIEGDGVRAIFIDGEGTECAVSHVHGNGAAVGVYELGDPEHSVALDIALQIVFRPLCVFPQNRFGVGSGDLEGLIQSLFGSSAGLVTGRDNKGVFHHSPLFHRRIVGEVPVYGQTRSPVGCRSGGKGFDPPLIALAFILVHRFHIDGTALIHLNGEAVHGVQHLIPGICLFCGEADPVGVLAVGGGRGRQPWGYVSYAVVLGIAALHMEAGIEYLGVARAVIDHQALRGIQV